MRKKLTLKVTLSYSLLQKFWRGQKFYNLPGEAGLLAEGAFQMFRCEAFKILITLITMILLMITLIITMITLIKTLIKKFILTLILTLITRLTMLITLITIITPRE